MNTILVTGGAGYIGSHACKALAAAGFTPVAFDNLHQGHGDAVRWGPFVQGDILDRAALDAAFTQWKPRAVMHFAGLSSVGESMAKPGDYARVNVQGSRTLLAAMARAGVARLVFSSSAAVYGDPRTDRIAETHPLEPVNPYGRNKLDVERAIAASAGLHAISLRYFNAAGADPDGESGERHDPETHLVPLLLESAAGRTTGFVLHGDAHPTPDGTCVRDFVHVSDLAQAHVLALRALEAGHVGGAFNLGNGRGFSVREVIDAAQRVTGQSIDVRIGPARPGDPPRLVADASKARDELGWQPRWPALDDIVASAWHWHDRSAAA